MEVRVIVTGLVIRTRCRSTVEVEVLVDVVEGVKEETFALVGAQ
jgi:hypothetical protein